MVSDRVEKYKRVFQEGRIVQTEPRVRRKLRGRLSTVIPPFRVLTFHIRVPRFES